MTKLHKPKDWVLMGLGNPGKEFARTWHNAGALFAESLNPEHAWHKEKQFRWTKLFEKLYVVVPETFMNESGVAAREAIKKFNVPPEQLIVAHDDSDITLGEFRLQIGRGAAGHNGIRSIQIVLDTSDFYRLRIGIRKEEGLHARRKAGDFVLTSMSSENYNVLADVFAAAGNIARKLIENE